MAPEKLALPIPALKSKLLFSLPAWRAGTVDETPYQLLQICDEADHCETLADLRGMPGMSIASDPTLGLSPDQLYLIVLRHVGVDEANHKIRAMSYELYDLARRAPAAFRTAEGKLATTDNIQGWEPFMGHGLEITVGRRKKSIALPQPPLTK